MGFGDWFKRRKPKKKEKESAPEPEKPREPAAEEVKEVAPELPAEKVEEPTPEPVAEETESTPEPPAEKVEEPTPEPRRLGFRDWFKKRRQKKKEKESAPEPEKPREPVPEEAEEVAPELPIQEAEEPIPEPIAEEAEEVAPEPLTEKVEEPTPEPRRLGFRDGFKRRKQKKQKKVEELKTKLQISEDELDEVKSSLPISCGPFEVKMLMVRDRLNDVLSKTPTRLSGASERNEIFNELDSLSNEIDNLAIELNASVGEYQIFVNCEYAKWFGMFKDIGLETEVTVKTAFQKEAPLEMRIDQINEVLDGGRSLTNETIKVAEQVYEVIRSFYAPDLPEESQSIAFAQKKLDEKATLWTALNVLFASLNNWNKQYKVQISKSVDHLQNSLASIANLSTKNERLLPVLGDNFPIIMENAKKAENIKLDIEKKTFNVINVLTIRDVFQSSLSIARDVLSILYEKLKSEEKAIEILAPSEDFLWEKNEALMKRMTSAIEVTSKSSNVKLSEVLESLPKFLSYVDECVETIALYNEIEELLLNYPIAEIAVEDLFREKKSISAEDLPFGPKYAEEYLKLFYSQKYREFSLDKQNMLLTKKT